MNNLISSVTPITNIYNDIIEQFQLTIIEKLNTLNNDKELKQSLLQFPNKLVTYTSEDVIVDNLIIHQGDDYNLGYHLGYNFTHVEFTFDENNNFYKCLAKLEFSKLNNVIQECGKFVFPTSTDLNLVLRCVDISFKDSELKIIMYENDFIERINNNIAKKES